MAVSTNNGDGLSSSIKSQWARGTITTTQELPKSQRIILRLSSLSVGFLRARLQQPIVAAQFQHARQAAESSR